MGKLFFKVSISLAFIIYLLFTVDWNVIWRAITGINVYYYTISSFSALVGPIFMALKYRLFISGTALSLSIPRLVAINFISRFYSLFVPSALGVEAVRWYKVTKNKQGRSFFLASTIVERLIFILTLIGFSLFPLIFYPYNPEINKLGGKLIPLLMAASIMICLALSFFISPLMRENIKCFVQKRISKLQNSKINKFINNFVLKQSLISILLPLLVFGLFWQLSNILRIFFLFKAMQLPFGLIDAAWMGSLVLMLQMIPASIAGLGIREGAYAYLFTLCELPPEQGVIIGILFFSQMLIYALIGGILELIEK